MFHRKPLEERIADRVAQRKPLKEGEHFEHGPAKFVFISFAVIIVLAHFIGFAILMP
ncbi:hypothetical protein [Nonomuraea pusilla]|uniref:Uncharacterized protein n=1 Tax=Nonomuraea pusilla TaxID=46177 RepID=A0A1H7L1I6_9ACTN|nr:hypothetical protein [Nonomuraea pusilla]SEK92899.1 hypothetical protein SAMN05660976_01433 [Nonomuraea pusilla]